MARIRHSALLHFLVTILQALRQDFSIAKGYPIKDPLTPFWLKKIFRMGSYVVEDDLEHGSSCCLYLLRAVIIHEHTHKHVYTSHIYTSREDMVVYTYNPST